MRDSFITRIEGEGRIYIYFRDGGVSKVSVEITEAPRFFEHIVRGKRIDYIPDILSRVCGLCGSSYVLAAVRAFEKCLGVRVPEEVDEFRKMVHLAERVKSHILHVFLLNLPDFIRVRDAFELRLVNEDVFKSVMRLMAYSRNIMNILGGRSHNVVNMRIGGVYRALSRDEVAKVVKFVEDLLNSFKPLADIVLSLSTVPNDYLDRPHLLLSYEKEYPHVSDEIVFSSPVGEERICVEDFEHAVSAEQVRGGNALLYRYRGWSYIVGPIARFNAAFSKLHGEVRDLLKSSGWLRPLSDVRQQVVARVAEVYDALLTMREYLEEYREPPATWVEYRGLGSGKATCVAAVEAPRGVLYHRFTIDNQLRVLECNIITPTAQNIASMEELSLEFLSRKHRGEIDEETAKKRVEEIVRAFDPCISCSVHAHVLKS